VETEKTLWEVLDIPKETKNEIINLCTKLVFSCDKKSEAYRELCKRYSGETLAFASCILALSFENKVQPSNILLLGI